MGVTAMPTVVPRRAIERARRLRKNMPEGEKRLWSELKRFRRWYGVHVRRQASIGDFTVDFAIHEYRLVIEVDGEHHFTAEGLARDARRDAWLRSVGYRVLRLNTGELSDSFDGCIEEILRALGISDNSLAPTALALPLKGEVGCGGSA